MKKHRSPQSNVDAPTLLDDTTKAELARINELSIGLAEANRARINARDAVGKVIAVGVDEDIAKQVIEEIRKIDRSNVDLDDSQNFGRGAVDLRSGSYSWSIDFLDEQTLKAMIESKFYCIRIKKL